jgi:hypothetical protein
MNKRPIEIARARRAREAFTLAELLVSVLIVTLIVFVVAQLMNNAAAITRTGHKRVSTDTQARVVLDRMALDFAQMLKRTDVDYYIKGPPNYTGHGQGHGWGRHLGTGQLGSDQIAFFTQVPGYYPSGAQSPYSLVAYRVNQSSTTNRAWMKLERLGRGLLWNGVSNTSTPLVFLPVTIGSQWPAAVNNGNNCGGANASCDPAYEIIGPGVFRFEYYYVLKNGKATDYPWDADAGHSSMAGIGLSDVEAIGVVIAVINSTDRAILDAATAANPTYTPLLDLASDLTDFADTHGRGYGNQTQYVGGLENDWEQALETVAQTGHTSSGSTFPSAIASAIKIYSRTFDLKTLPTF